MKPPVFIQVARRMAMLALVMSAAPISAQPQTTPSPEEIVRALQPPTMTRSMGGASQTRNLKPMVDLTVNFDFDSATLREDGKMPLRNLATALSDARLSGLRFMVEGHTDAKGSTSYNDALSARRAKAVVSFLASEGISVERLESVGKGFRELLEPTDPQSPLNRRVRILTLQ